jgi:hypothetical protein
MERQKEKGKSTNPQRQRYQALSNREKMSEASRKTSKLESAGSHFYFLPFSFCLILG